MFRALSSPRRLRIALSCATLALSTTMAWSTPSRAALPDHPVITEVYRDALGNDGPVGREPTKLHQEFIEIYLPTLDDLAVGLSADALAITFYEVEGDSSSLNTGLVNYRIDLPVFDLDPSNGLTGLPRPPSGLVVLGWVDYVGSPPVGLAGTPSTRLGLVNGGITESRDYTFIAINGAQFDGTTNFPVPVAVSHLDLVTDPSVGKISQGAAVYMLVDRNTPGYLSYCGATDPAPCNSFPDLPSGFGLQVASVLDAFANNDDANFVVNKQPYLPPTGDNIDLEFILPLGGAFTPIVPQLEENGEGHQRRFIDSVKTSEDALVGNEDPAIDAVNVYLDVVNAGPFRPTPGHAPFSASGAELALADDAAQVFDLLAGTTAHAGLVAANIGGNRSMDFVTIPESTGPETFVSFFADFSDSPPVGQAFVGPAVGAVVARDSVAGHLETATFRVEDTPDPPLSTSARSVTATYRVINPTFGLSELGFPLQGTALLAGLGLPDEPGVANELMTTSVGQWLAPRLGISVFDARGEGIVLLNPLTDLSNPVLVDSLIATIPDLPANYINDPGPLGKPDLVQTMLSSAEVRAGTGTYDDSFNPTQTLLQARRFDLIPPAVTTSSPFVPSERVHYADAGGNLGQIHSGLTNVETTRGFGLIMIETHLGPTGVLESGETDDFGLVVRAAAVAPTSTIVPGEFIPLSYSGGLQGADIDTLNLPPGNVQTSVVLLDLEHLYDEMGVISIDRLYVVDGSGAREAEFIDVFFVPEPGFVAGLSLAAGSLLLAGRRRPRKAVRSTA